MNRSFCTRQFEHLSWRAGSWTPLSVIFQPLAIQDRRRSHGPWGPRPQKYSWRTALIKQPCVYILASEQNGTLYVGVTSDLRSRTWQHKNDEIEGFTRRYSVHTLVWYEVHESMSGAIQREKAIKNWTRARKLETIEAINPEWRDL
jgi:putative endonuclease